MFVEILKQFLLNQGYDKRDINFNNDLNNVDRVNVVLAKLSEVVSDDEHKRKIKLFEQCVNDIFVNEDLLIKFVLFLKEVYEWYHVVTYSSNGNSTCSNVQTVRGDVNGDNNDLVGLVNQKKNDVMYSLIRSERFSISPSNRTVCRNYSHSNFNFYLNPNSNRNNNNKNDNKKSFTLNTIDSHNSTNNQTYLNINLNNNNNNNSTIHRRNNSINYNNKTITHNINNNNNNNIIYNYKPHYKYYTKTPKTKHLHKQIHLTTGIITPSNQSTQFNYYSFIKPTSLINSISLSSLSKHKYKYIPYKPRSSNSLKPKTPSPLLIPSPPLCPETKIKKWLLSLRLISNQHLNTSLTTLSNDGTLLCNILNRNEPPYQVIKGIFTSPTTPNQIRININKACVYISTHMHYFINHYLKENKYIYEEELLKGNDEMMFYVIESLYKYYNRLSYNSRNRFNRSNGLHAYNSVTHNDNELKMNSVYNERNVINKKKNKLNCSSNESLKLSQVDGNAFMKYCDVDDEFHIPKEKKQNTIEVIKSNKNINNDHCFKKKSYSCRNNNNRNNNNNNRRDRNRYDDNEYHRCKSKDKENETVKCFLLFQKSNLDKMKKEIENKNNILKEYTDDYP